MRAGIFPAESASRKLFQRFAWPGRIGVSAHLTLSCAAACTTWYSTGPTTARKSPSRTTLTFGRCLIELSSTDSGFAKPSVSHGPWPGRIQRRVQHAREPDVVRVGELAATPSPGCRRAAPSCRPACTGSTGFAGADAVLQRRRRQVDVEELAADELAVGDGLAAARDDALARRSGSRPGRPASSRRA